jgi:putative sugar O-methyltransferase
VRSSPNVYKYLYELMELRSSFGDPEGFLKSWNILEVGGGYGGLATTVGHFYGDVVGDYNVVDLAPVCKLQRKYLDAIGSSITDKFKCIPSTERGALEGKDIDLFISFFSISEQKKEVVDFYFKEYASKSKRGYLQLNYDEETYWGMEQGRYNILQIFKEVYKLHPDAVLMGPGACGVYNHHRIKWGM